MQRVRATMGWVHRLGNGTVRPRDVVGAAFLLVGAGVLVTALTTVAFVGSLDLARSPELLGHLVGDAIGTFDRTMADVGSSWNDTAFR